MFCILTVWFKFFDYYAAIFIKINMADDYHSDAEIMSQSLVDTQPVLSSQDVGLLHDNEKPKICWGQLYPLYLPGKEPFNLIRNSYSVGRHLNCDLTLLERDVGQKLYLQISKMQFSVNKHPGLPNVSYIVDHSTNGTFVNGKKLGKNNRHLLSNDDIISIASRYNKVYAFVEFKPKDDIHEKVKQKYITFDVIGSGAFGEVREVVEKETMKRYAMKIIRLDPSEYDKVFNEIVILYKVKHLNIVRMQDMIKTESQLFIVLELMHGDLAHRLKVQKHLSEPVTKHILYQCTLALHYLHKNNIVHRDMKPANILLSSNEEFPIVKIADFGLATILTKSTVQTSTVCGTRPYAAPEMICGRRILYSTKIDVWSLGVILFYCLSGELPFIKSRTDMPLESQIKTANFSFSNKIWISISNAAKEIILKMLVVKAKERISMDDILSDAWIEQDMRMKIRVHEMKEHPKRNILDEDITTEVKRFRVSGDL